MTKKFTEEKYQKIIDKSVAKMVANHFEEMEDEKMTKKFTEEEYQKIADCFDKVNEKYNMGLLDSDLVDEVYEKFCRDYDYQLYWQEIVAIMNPITRDEAHEKFVEKEKKYFWTGKTTDKDGRYVHISRDDKNKPKIIRSRECNPIGYLFTETEVKAAYLDVDMFDKEEVE